MFERDTSRGGAGAEIDSRLGGAFTRVLCARRFPGRKDDTLRAATRRAGTTIAAERVLAASVSGKREDYTLERCAAASARAVRAGREAAAFADRAGLDHVEQARASAWARSSRPRRALDAGVLAALGFPRAEEPAAEDPPSTPVEELVLVARDERRESRVRGRALARARSRRGRRTSRATLQSRPGNVATPTLPRRAWPQAIAKDVRHEVAVLDRERMREGAHARAAGRGAGLRRGAALHRPASISGAGRTDAPLALVGKGLTFDAGGISIKPARAHGGHEVRHVRRARP